MDTKVLDMAFGETATLLALKTFDLQHKSSYDKYSLSSEYNNRNPMFNGDEVSYPNLISVNDKTICQKIYNGIAYHTIEPKQLSNNKDVKVYNQTEKDPLNPFNFLSKSLVF